MEPASRTPEGESTTCDVCGCFVTLEPSRLPGDATCPNCGVLLWFDELPSGVVDYLASRGAFAEANVSGDIISIRFVGEVYDDQSVLWLSKITGLLVMDICETQISELGAASLQFLMPDTKVISRSKPN